jgi:hypothetical protein
MEARMKIVQGDELPIHESRSNRQGTLAKTYVIRAEDLGPGDFVCGLYHQSGDFYAPRHRHNFDQWRFQVVGESRLGTSGTLKTGMLGYFPEGAYYGPNGKDQDAPDEPNVVVLVQFGGPSGNGYLSQGRSFAALEAMQQFGRFEGGVFYRNEGVPGKPATDSFQAIWEYANGRPLAYPKAQYNAAILMDANNYRWMPLDGVPGVEEKALGTFTDCKIRAAQYKLDPGATFTAEGRGIFVPLSGTGTVAGEPYRRFTAVYLETGESAAFRAGTTSEILLLGLPEIARMKTPLPAGVAADEREELAEA